MASSNFKSVTFLGQQCNVEFGKYSNGRVAIGLVISSTGEPMTVASINFPFVEMANDEVAIKNYSENEGILDLLIAANIISTPVRFTQSGFIQSPICKII
jgi:hypothetical protein